MTDIITLSDPRVAAVAAAECGEPLVDLRCTGQLRLDHRQADDDGSYARLRSGALRRLVRAQRLLPAGVRFLVVEGYRPPDLQRRYFEQYAQTMRLAHPDAAPERIRELASAYISPPEVAPHVSGGAVDLTLCDQDGKELPLGTEVNATPEESEGACRTEAPGISAEARANRALMSWALTATGFVNYPTEWWHWSYGDRYWALLRQAPAARYGPATPPGPTA
ncbi:MULTISPECIES: M15 family metallopeptidase [unclassified Streptomyces]|uniref:M15 family metallopeptidase n=1 Tax=unclassified Streptomyces TaxID=2593676 RepID=UPI00224DAA98|nr:MULTISPECIES: M15 family metallopeptidase [unclassified Streptomyces]MCX5053046.1 M15 family metallopeptidase [Streptomyces sp. NBC_00474]MCX5062799.1 M15 family metallopeptidase [Streptomyces sp. NBC_00452]MCX5250478.1 M15 family metallopeptidase [Streptomyces sp. NBC_00201]MCX5291595.1 M15 family metallopeptidase [Streptomyces sp. NBC_00183]